MTAEDFKAFTELARIKYKANDSTLAAALGCCRQSIRKWRHQGAPPYIGLAVSAIMAGLDPWTQSDLPNQIQTDPE